MNEEQNRKIAEWLELPCMMCRGPAKEHPSKVCDRYWTKDFYADESANALVLEKMPEDYACIFRDDVHGGWYVGHGGDKGFNKDRKTAIAEAALKLIEQESQ